MSECLFKKQYGAGTETDTEIRHLQVSSPIEYVSFLAFDGFLHSAKPF